MRHTLLRLGLAAALFAPASFVAPARAAGGCTAMNPTLPATLATNETKPTCSYPATDLGSYKAIVDGPWLITKNCSVANQRNCPAINWLATGTGPNQGLLSTAPNDTVRVTIGAGTIGAITASDR